MKYEDRKAVAREMVTAFLSRFTPPRGMCEDGQVAMISAIADAFGRKMPVVPAEEYRDKVGEVLTRVADLHTTYAWPPQGVFVEAMPKGYGVGKKAPKTFSGSSWAAAIRDGRSVPEGVVWGIEGALLVTNAEITSSELASYREGSLRAWKTTYGDDAVDLLAGKYGAEVNRHLMGAVV